MRTTLKTTNFEHSGAIDALAEEKIIKPLKKLLADIDGKTDTLVDIEFELTTKHHRKGKIWRVEAQLALPRVSRELRAEATGESLREAADSVKDTLLREIKKYKARR